MTVTQVKTSNENIMLQSIETAKNELMVVSDNINDEEVKNALKELDITNSNSILSFGVETQKGLTKHADEMIGSTKNKDTGAAAAVMNELMVEIRGLKGDDLKESNWLEKLIQKFFKTVTPIQKFIQQYESVQSQIASTVNEMEKKQNILKNDIEMLDVMYKETLDFYHKLSVYIKAGEFSIGENKAKLKEMQENVTEEIVDQQKIKDFADSITELERKVDDLKLTQAVTLQMMPQIRMTQDTDKGLVSKMITICNTTIPMWKNQIALAITQENQKGATKVIKAANDATNEMLRENAKRLRQNTLDAKKEIERGVVDAETIREVNIEVINTIEESVKISMEARKRREESDIILNESKEKLKEALKNASKVISE